ncbi:MAG: ABC transporter permease [Acidimicrobiales bacterium]
MGRYAAYRLLVAVPTLLSLSFLVFTLVSVAPGDPAVELAKRRFSNREITDADVVQARHQLHLDQPFLVQYGRWLAGAAHGQLGTSFSNEAPVAAQIGGAAGASAELAGVAFVLIIAAAAPLGVVAAVFHRRWPDGLLRVLALVGASVPSFFLAYVLIIVFVTRYHLFPVAGRTGPSSVVLPAVSLAVLPIAVVSRLLRSSLLEVLTEDYMRTARAKGLSPWRVVVRHGLRNAAIPVVTYLGGLLGGLLEGVVIVEAIFAWPGLGRLAFEAISQRDYPMIEGVVVLAGAVYIVMNLVVDLSYRLFDPRVRVDGGGAGS